jgi:hypothetical protein
MHLKLEKKVKNRIDREKNSGRSFSKGERRKITLTKK